MKIPKYYKFIFFFFFVFLFLFQIQRLILLAFNWNVLETISNSEILFTVFNRGLLFDLYVCSYFSTVPFLILGILSIFFPKENYKSLFVFFKYYYFLLLTLSISILVSDIIYYEYYSIRLTKTILDWTNDLTSVLNILTKDTNYIITNLIILILIASTLFLASPRVNKIIKTIQQGPKLIIRIPLFLVSVFILIIGLRGTYKFHKMPLTKIDAYYSKTPLLNQANFNPIYTFVDSYNKFKIDHFKETDQAIEYASNILKSDKSNPISPVFRLNKGTEKPKKNVILLLVESLSKNTLSYHNPNLKTTPFLDSLITKSMYFENIFSANTHTHGGIYSTLFSYPLSTQEHAMNSVETANLNYFGLPTFFSKYNYQNYFYIGGDEHFDNMNSFLMNNSFDRFVADADYSANHSRNAWGVNDKVILSKSIEHADSLHKISQPFFQSILTVSTHKGYKVEPKENDQLFHQKAPYNMYESFDNNLKNYFKSVENKPWFNETMFVIIGDHGQVFDPVYDMPLSYHKIPLLIYSKSGIEPQKISDIGMQIDVFPTLAGLFKANYPNNTLGIDLLKSKRDFAYFCSDSKLGVIDLKHFLIYNSSSNMNLFDYKNKSQKDIKDKHKDKVDRMLNYMFSMLQTKDYLLSSQKSDLTKTELK